MLKGIRMRAVERENRMLREALDWYAFKGNWRRRGINPKGAPRKWEKSPAAFDRGARARVVIRAIDTPSGTFKRLFRRLMGRAAAPIKPPTVPQPLAARESTTTTRSNA